MKGIAIKKLLWEDKKGDLESKALDRGMDMSLTVIGYKAYTTKHPLCARLHVNDKP